MITKHTRSREPAPPARPRVVAGVILIGLVSILMPILFSPGPVSSERGPVGSPADPPPAAEEADSARPKVALSVQPASTAVEEHWGIQINGVRVALGGNGLDLRYTVVDPSKATNLFHLQEGTYVIDQTSGRAIHVPFQKENQTSQKLVAGRTYFALLPNKGQVVRAGSKVTVAIGNTRERDVLVQ